MKLRVYFDTSVFCAYYDDRATDRQRETEELWKRLQDFDVATSELAREELEQTADPEQRAGFQMLLNEYSSDRSIQHICDSAPSGRTVKVCS